MTTTVKITELANIGANIATNTLVPVVNMAGTPETQKANLQIVGNLILNQAGNNLVRAAQANIALSVVNAAQPNITSVGTLTTLTVSGNVTAGNIITSGKANLGNSGNVIITGGSAGYVLSTDGAGNLSWTAGGGGIQGLQGVNGSQGLQGVNGSQGIQGQSGTQGTQGVNGSQGIQGLQGILGVQGTTGVQGSLGLQGYDGVDSATTLRYTLQDTANANPSGAGNFSSCCNVGLALTNSFKFAYGTLAGQPAEGFFDTINAALSGGISAYIQVSQANNPGISALYKVSSISYSDPGNGGQYNVAIDGGAAIYGYGNWTVGLEYGISMVLNGAQGIQGTVGIQGIQGIQGAQGTNGIQGVQGFGYNQLQGLQGLQGTSFSTTLSANLNANNYSISNIGNLSASSSNFTGNLYFSNNSSIQENSGFMVIKGQNGGEIQYEDGVVSSYSTGANSSYAYMFATNGTTDSILSLAPLNANISNANLTVSGNVYVTSNIDLTGNLIFNNNTEQNTAWTGSVSEIKNGGSNITIPQSSGNIDFHISTLMYGRIGSAIQFGYQAGDSNILANGIAIGTRASQHDQGNLAISLGTYAGHQTQGNFAVSIGSNAGYIYQSNNAIAIGKNAGYTNQGANSIAIGALAGNTDQSANSIVLNATGAALDAANQGLYIAPVRNDTGNTTNTLFFNSSTKEFTYSSSYNTIKTSGDTYANLPLAGTAGAGTRAFVTDSNLVMAGNFGATLTGGGSNGVPVVSDGTNWRIG